MIRVVEQEALFVVEGGRRLIEGDAMLLPIGPILTWVPLERDLGYCIMYIQRMYIEGPRFSFEALPNSNSTSYGPIMAGPTPRAQQVSQ